jgi:hypothetical protein
VVRELTGSRICVEQITGPLTRDPLHSHCGVVGYMYHPQCHVVWDGTHSFVGKV